MIRLPDLSHPAVVIITVASICSVFLADFRLIFNLMGKVMDIIQTFGCHGYLHLEVA